ncbi:effector binding domain-containing protein [Sporosarcina sp. 179-K 8C2 HS]|uniref:GyrI-like domain-containing protein n=1 Tax=Sporosarcina sp. 179-K 8C2 HS TaxID=3142387 RepID=UPI00399F2C5D
MDVKTVATFACEVVKREFELVGQSITADFPQSFLDAAMKVQMEFEKRIDEVKGCKNKHVLISPYMCNDIVATYFACVEVDNLTEIPEGMVGFRIPMMEYAKISCSNKTIDQGYSKLFAWMSENGYKQKWYDKSFPIEIFYLEEGAEEEVVEILIPIQ